MLWKETYRIGVDEIDRQHQELFIKVSDFIDVVRSPKPWEEKIKFVEQTLTFMKDYVVRHFRDEEAYQESIGYPLFEKHLKIHQDMVQYVAQIEKEFLENDTDEKFMQQFAGKLLAWLINHVASEDLKIGNYARGKQIADKKMTNSFLDSTKEVFKLMMNLDINEVSGEISQEESIAIKIGVTGDRIGEVVYIFTKDTIINIVKLMSGMAVEDIDEFASSAIGEIANIISGKALIAMSQEKIVCDILPPERVNINEINFQSAIKTTLETPVGPLELLVHLKEAQYVS
jgi:hemerythrin